MEPANKGVSARLSNCSYHRTHNGDGTRYHSDGRFGSSLPKYGSEFRSCPRFLCLSFNFTLNGAIVAQRFLKRRKGKAITSQIAYPSRKHINWRGGLFASNQGGRDTMILAGERIHLQ